MRDKFLKLTLALLALCFAFYIYLYPPNKSTQVSECVTCNEDTPGQTFSHFSDVVNNYRTKIWDTINQKNFSQATTGVGKAQLRSIYNNTDARTIWFDLDSIKQFICTIEKYNQKITPQATDLGIRFFYAVYDSNDPIVERRNRHTLFMVPTQKSADGSNVDFDPREIYQQQTANTQGYQVYRKEFPKATVSFVDLFRPTPLVAPINQYSLILGANNSGTSTIQNNGEICPTKCPNVNTLDVIDP